MSDTVHLPYFQHINTTLGLKYLNGDTQLYLRFLKNFLEHYENLSLEEFDNEQLGESMEIIVNLSSTLGMSTLSRVAKNISKSSSKEELFEFYRTLILVIDELQTEFNSESISTILIVENSSKDIDKLIGFLDDKNDIIVTQNEIDTLESIHNEDISLVLLYPHIDKDLSSIYKTLKRKATPVVFMLDHIDYHLLEYMNYIQKPFNKDELTKCLKEHLA
jgi:hypothetical protein